jgi:hypothetical protein
MSIAVSGVHDPESTSNLLFGPERFFGRLTVDPAALGRLTDGEVSDDQFGAIREDESLVDDAGLAPQNVSLSYPDYHQPAGKRNHPPVRVCAIFPFAIMIAGIGVAIGSIELAWYGRSLGTGMGRGLEITAFFFFVGDVAFAFFGGWFWIWRLCGCG